MNNDEPIVWFFIKIFFKKHWRVFTTLYMLNKKQKDMRTISFVLRFSSYSFVCCLCIIAGERIGNVLLSHTFQYCLHFSIKFIFIQIQTSNQYKPFMHNIHKNKEQNLYNC